MKKPKCLLCELEAEKSAYKTLQALPTKISGGFRYRCPECKLYALYNREFRWVKKFATEEQKRILSEYVRNNQLEDEFLKLEMNDIKKILGLP